MRSHYEESPCCSRGLVCGRDNARRVSLNARRVLVDLARMLQDAGADANIRDDKYNATALGWAVYCTQPRIAELLRQRGAIE